MREEVMHRCPSRDRGQRQKLRLVQLAIKVRSAVGQVKVSVFTCQAPFKSANNKVPGT